MDKKRLRGVQSTLPESETPGNQATQPNSHATKAREAAVAPIRMSASPAPTNITLKHPVSSKNPPNRDGYISLSLPAIYLIIGSDRPTSLPSARQRYGDSSEEVGNSMQRWLGAWHQSRPSSYPMRYTFPRKSTGRSTQRAGSALSGEGG